MKFSETGLHPTILSVIEKCKFEDCTPIQEVTIPPIVAGRDVAGLAQTGTGKTAAFLLPLMDRMVRGREAAEQGETDTEKSKTHVAFDNWKPTNYILVLVPTRELAEQVHENVKTFGTDLGFKSVAIYGGTSYESQKEAIGGGVEFVVATPGRLIDLYKEHIVDLAQVRGVVFDEADRMFDMGFKDDMKYILRRIDRSRQFLVFSATLNFDVLNTAYEFGADPVEFNVSKDQAKAENVDDEIFHVGDGEKAKYLLSLIKRNQPKQAIIFSNFKHNVERIAQFLSDNGIPAMGISSLLSQAQRNKVMEKFKAENDRNILVATDVAARGLDIKGVDLIVNYELPDDAENYVHRIGRTGRAGARGLAFSLTSDRDVDALSRIEEYLGHKMTIAWMEDADFVEEMKPFPRDVPYHKVRGLQKRGNDRGKKPSGPRGGGRSSTRRKPGDKPKDKRAGERSERPERSGERSNRRNNEERSENKRRGSSSEQKKRPRRTSDSRSREDEKQNSGESHRDKRMGRHRTSSEQSSDKKQSRPSNKKTGGKVNRTKKISGGKKYRGGRYRVEQKPKTVGEKVSGFIKRLFS